MSRKEEKTVEYDEVEGVGRGDDGGSEVEEQAKETGEERMWEQR